MVAWGRTTVPAGLNGVVAISAGEFFSLALKNDGTVVAWGSDNYGQSTVPAGLNGVVAISAGEQFSLALKGDGTVVAWGQNDAGQTTVPAVLNGVIAIAAGYHHSLALKSDGTVVAWGDNYYGECTVPAGLNGVLAIAAGNGFSLALVAPQGPSITAAPQSQTVQSGSGVNFSVTATGTQPLSYQWQFNGQPIQGANASTLILNSVSAASSGGYSVIVSNPYGSSLSANASLAVLTDGANGNNPEQISPTGTPNVPINVDSMVVVTHGFAWDGALADESWVANMATTIQQRVPGNWFVYPYVWSGQAWGTPDLALVAAAIQGGVFGTAVGEQHLKHVHLIGHSAGAAFVEAAATAIKKVSPSTTVHTTFLDPYLSSLLVGADIYGLNADWSDCYYVEDWTGVFTSGNLPNSFNVDVSWTDPSHTETPIPCPSSTDDSSPPDLNNICGYQAWSSHGYPITFYSNSIVSALPECASAYGFPMSKEGGGWDNRASFPDNSGNPLVVCGLPPLPQSQFPLSAALPLSLSGLPLATSSVGAAFLGDDSVSLSADDPAWIALGLTITNSVNIIQFDSGFTDTNQTDGVLSVYWNTNLIGTVDERVAASGLQTYRFALPGTVTSGVFTLSFRLDAFSDATSIAITNIATAYIGITQPIALQIQAPVSNAPPIMQLIAPAGYNYLLQSSTDLLDWTPLALLVNTNGIVPFTDSTWTNASTRFYRALIP